MSTYFDFFKKYGSVTLAGTSLGLSFLHPWLWPLVFVGAVLTLQVFEEELTPRKAAIRGLQIGTIKSAIVLLWGFSVYPLDWLGISSPFVQVLLISFYWIPSAIALGSGMAFLGYLYFQFIRTRHTVIVIVGVAVLWTLAEVVGALVFSAYMLGPGSTINANFSFGHTGYALVPHNFLFLFAVVLGVYSLSFLVGGLGASLFMLHKNKWRWRYLVVGIILVSSVVPYNAGERSKLAHSVMLVGTNFPFVSEARQQDSSYNQVFIRALRATSDTSAAYVLFPEDSRLTNVLSNSKTALGYLSHITDEPRVYIDSARLDVDAAAYLRAYIYDTRADEVYTFDKQYLVPQGEYLPFIYGGILELFAGDSEVMDFFRTHRTYQPGVPQSYTDVPQYVPGVLFCFESAAPFGVRNSIKHREGVPFVAHIVSHAWFNRAPETLWNQLDAMLLTQAKFNHIPIVQTANEAPLKIYYPDGRIEYPEILQNETEWSLGIIGG